MTRFLSHLSSYFSGSLASAHLATTSVAAPIGTNASSGFSCTLPCLHLQSVVSQISTIEWGLCSNFSAVTDPALACALFTVPLDYHNASAGNGRIVIAKSLATAEPRLGTVFFNPGLLTACCSGWRRMLIRLTASRGSGSVGRASPWPPQRSTARFHWRSIRCC